LQLKATESIGYVQEALNAHPGIDVVIPTELYEHLDKLGDHQELLQHLLNGHANLADIGDHVGHAVDAANAADPVGHFPIAGPALVIGLTAFMNWRKCRNRQMSALEYYRSIGERGILAFIATGAGHAVNLLAGEPFVGIPVAVVTRMVGGQVLHNVHRREELDKMVQNVDESIAQLSAAWQRHLPVPELSD